MSFEPIDVKDIPQEVLDYALRYIDKNKTVNYMRPVAYGAFIEGALYAMGKYVSHYDKNFKQLKNHLITE